MNNYNVYAVSAHINTMILCHGFEYVPRNLNYTLVIMNFS